MNARPLGATCAGSAGAALLFFGGAPWPAALLGGSGVVVFALVRTVPGVWIAFGLLLAASGAGWTLQPRGVTGVPWPLLPWLAVLEAYGIATIAAVRAAREPVQVSRRLLGAWLASTGALVLGLALSAGRGTDDAAAVLLVVGLLYKLGVVPAYAWAPMLLRHRSAPIVAAGAVGQALTLVILLVTLPTLWNGDAGAVTVLALGAVTAPWALWNLVRQWRTDRRCAVTYAVVAMLSVGLLWFVGMVVG